MSFGDVNETTLLLHCIKRELIVWDLNFQSQKSRLSNDPTSISHKSFLVGFVFVVFPFKAMSIVMLRRSIVRFFFVLVHGIVRFTQTWLLIFVRHKYHWICTLSVARLQTSDIRCTMIHRHGKGLRLVCIKGYTLLTAKVSGSLFHAVPPSLHLVFFKAVEIWSFDTWALWVVIA